MVVLFAFWQSYWLIHLVLSEKQTLYRQLDLDFGPSNLYRAIETCTSPPDFCLQTSFLLARYVSWF